MDGISVENFMDCEESNMLCQELFKRLKYCYWELSAAATIFVDENIAPSSYVNILIMIKPVFKRQFRCIPVLILAFLIFPAFRFAAAQTGNIILKDEQIPVTPKEFYIANVTDERDNRGAVAWILPPANITDQAKAYPVDLQGGALFAIKQFIERNLPRDTAYRPITIGLKKFMVTESALTGGKVEGHVAVVMSFDITRGDNETLHLLDYKGNATYTRNAGPPQEIEPTLRHTLENGLIYLNTWMDRQAATNIKLAKAVKISFTDYEEKPEGDTIYYSFKRPLTWDDFQSKIPAGRYDAEVYPTIGYDEHTDVAKSVINVSLAIKVCLPKSASWVRDGSRNDYSLNHEQRHFDIAKIAAKHFKEKLNAENLTVGNYEGIINFDYLEAYREMNNMQKQYDDETRHGSDESAQQQWNERIDGELGKVIGH
jgi:hypothetical protein